jgi:hypothetical protein
MFWLSRKKLSGSYAFPTWGGISPFANVHPVRSLAATG